MKMIISILLLAVSLPATASNYATCLLKHMPGLSNDAAAYSGVRFCLNEHPGGLLAVEKGEGRGILSYKSGAECALKVGGETHSLHAGRMIVLACYRLYDKPNPFDTFDRPTAGMFDDVLKK